MKSAVATSNPEHSPSPPESGAAIRVNQLSKTYRTGLFGGRLFGSGFTALKGISFTVQRGEIFGLLGPNGAGKTTFLKILLGIIRKSGGSAEMLGTPAGSIRGRMKVGYLPEHLRIPGHLTGYTALEVYGNLSNVPTRVIRQRQDQLFEQVGLAGRAGDKVKNYSKGMRQRLGLAQALLHEPELLVLDEPTDGLDPRARADIRNMIRELQKQGVTIFLNSHILQEVEMICQRVAILDRGNMMYCGPVNQISDAVPSLAGTSGSGKFHLVVLGEREAIERGFHGTGYEIVVDKKEASPQPSASVPELEVRVSFQQDDELDALVDRLRSENVRIRGIEKKSISLEDAFLQIVHGNRDSVNGDSPG